MPKVRATQTEVELEVIPGSVVTEKPPKPQPEPYLKDGFPNPQAHSVWDYTQLLDEEQWKTHIAYLYRTAPTILRTGNKPNYLAKYVGPISLEEIAEEYGGKAFLLILKRGKNKVYEERFGVEAPPKFKGGETPESAGEEKEKATAAGAASDDLLRSLVADLITQRDMASSTGKEFNASTTLQNSLSLYGKASEAAIDLVTKHKGGEGMADKMIGLLMPKLMERLLNPEPAPNPLDQLAATATLLKELQGEAPPAGDGPGNWKIALAQSLGAKADSIFEKIEKSLSHYARAQENRAAVMLAGRGFSVRTAPSTDAGGAPTPAQPLQTSATVPPPPPSTGQPPSAPNVTEPVPGEPTPQLSMPDFIKGKLVELLFSGKDGDTAAIFAETMDGAFAEEIARVMKENPEELAKDNILAQGMRHPNLKTFCKDYVDYFEGEPGPEDPPPPAGEE